MTEFLAAMSDVEDKGRLGASADARLAAIVDSSFDAIISKDLTSVITSWNLAAERMFGYSPEEAVGQSILMLIPDHLKGEETEIISRVRSGDRVASYETTRRRKDGSLIAVSLTVSPVRNGVGEIIGASQIARDISAAKESERRIRLLMREVNHRVKNQFAVILSMVRETSKRSSDPQEFEELIRARIMALSRSHDLLVTSEWAGASLFDLIQEHLKPFGREEQILLSGPVLTLQSNAVQNLGMAFHELGTNSSKYGALSSDAGRVEITWTIGSSALGEREFQLTWEETSKPRPGDRRDETTRKGFGTVVLQRVAPQSLGGSAVLERSPGHLKWRLSAPLASIIVAQAGTEPIADAAGLGI
ncbi:PAS domain S-box protein [Mesorhizobium sp. M00.F.Ca.ET.151.01.1.1]|uniref:sensor histidine kinase n=2 Tax=unclassified Mesorhizobium TaxID=325217 RepID=UPI000FCA4C9F|nr:MULTISPECIES: PAS domain S-box protein [unclassified Mesorhizobium]RUW52122.1 PAS domain S-box protein [Mesorhizobium sp. M8A.F.Ca.ET.021.01.1.1]RUX08979.1 PAS domain S-box protein [Mesorhizobium sp. M8A.F.Ca.ET.059.01.1.1]TGP90018.1 PAS domain S-box protein [Mesorhizobium sp. M8A.F.Ca.ET.218.01.1.1]TGQ86479.1 PAS domain S-box protein [Mesorhizobium sp. M8A.F.Ca.ET.208.01.1.1]TGR29259.1 PAS domain S-box protein [Mesorhizobium sp. M8A.F.Ca.ET.202.01.1.1]TGR29948.1 PAS domain S-box protein [